MLTLDSFSPAFSANPVAGLDHPGKSVTKASPSSSPMEIKLRKAASEFESMLLTSLWKSMKSTFSDSDSDSDDPAHDTLEDMGMNAMASAIGKAGGFGIGKLILKHLEPMPLDSKNGNAAKNGKLSFLPADNFE